MNDKKPLIIALVVILFFAALVIAGVLFGVALILSNSKPVPAPIVNTVEELPVTPPVKISRFASDSGILKLQKDLKDIQTKIDTMDLFESQITPPVFDLNIAIPPQN
jgi:hypothetical protein